MLKKENVLVLGDHVSATTQIPSKAVSNKAVMVVSTNVHVQLYVYLTL